ncbi:(-)-alpha-terpineol synthase-like [Asparagus officinalis]|uniref:(-)-alpha-terpineol synthase-like n=1 Tax=Asparagus officinalis TaxID=4686 RepID=UPI00098E5DB1|nr:(-)-alpha-terpineol synthase-like [Asparagus officinalis]
MQNKEFKHYFTDSRIFFFPFIRNYPVDRSLNCFHQDDLVNSLYFWSADIFDHFKDVNGSFKASLSHDAKGLLSLYQASYLSFKEEITMDAARAFAVTHLKTLDASKLRFAKEIADVMELPSHWRPTRLEARRYIDTYEKEEDTNSALLLFAKLDFNMVQNVHQRELAKVTSWWMGLSLGKTLEFARDRTLECFFVVIIIVFQPHFGYSREGLTKVITLMVLLDDVYDVYGSLDELELFTRAVERWEVEELENLPECMKICFTNISNLVGEMTVDFQKSNGLTILPYLRKAWTDICKAFLVEAKWQNDNYVPTFEEYINNGWMSVSGPLILLHTFPLMGQEITVKALEHLENYPKIIRLASKIFRLYNDLATSTAELERGDSVSSIQCYMRESGDSEVEARKHISSLIFETWKELNEEAILCSSLPRFFIEACVNLGRMAICLYQHGDGFGIPTHDTKAHITSLLMKPISLQSKELQTPINNVVAK